MASNGTSTIARLLISILAVAVGAMVWWVLETMLNEITTLDNRLDTIEAKIDLESRNERRIDDHLNAHGADLSKRSSSSSPSPSSAPSSSTR